MTEPRVFVLDNYDSFTFNLVQLLGRIGADVTVARNDEVSVAEVRDAAARRDRHLARPVAAGEGGHQRRAGSRSSARPCRSSACAWGTRPSGWRTAPRSSACRRSTARRRRSTTRRAASFADLASPISAARYHSLAIDRDSLPAELEVTAWSEDGVVMGVRHRSHPVEGFQFHPESILTDDGEALLTAFLARVGGAGMTDQARRAAAGGLRGGRAGRGRRDPPGAAGRGGDGRADGRLRPTGPGRRPAGHDAGAGRDAGGGRRLRTRHADPGRPGRCARRRRRPVRHRRRRPPHLQHLDPVGLRGRRCRRAGGEARQPRDHVALRLGRPRRGARNPARSRPGGGGPLDPGDRLRLHVRARLPPGHEARHADPSRAADADDLQPPRPALVARRRPAPAARAWPTRRWCRSSPGH